MEIPRRIPAAIAWAIALAVVGALLLAAGGAWADERESPCRLSRDKWAEPAELWLGDWTTVWLTSTTDCPAQLIPLHIVLCIDGSNSMNPQNKLVEAKRAATQFVNELDFAVTKVGVTRFGGDVTVMTPLTDARAQALAAIGAIHTNFGTDMEGGIAQSHRLLEDARTEDRSSSEPEPIEVIVLLSDGKPYPSGNNPMRTAARAKGSGILMITVCVGGDCDSGLMRQLASRPDLFFNVQQSGRLVAVYTEIAHQLQRTELRRLTIEDEVPANMRFVEGSANIAPDVWQGGVLQWNLTSVLSAGITLTYQLEPLAEGVWPTNVRATGRFWDTEDRIGSYEFPVPTVRVRMPTATSTPTASASSTPSPSSTATATATPTTTPSTTPSPVPRPVFLPLLLADRCAPSRKPADVVLVLDCSTSMDWPTEPGGPSKRAAAAEAAGRFIGLLDPGRDRIGIVAFHDAAVTLAPLGEPGAPARGLLERLPRHEGTSIDLGLRAARSLLAAGQRRAEATAAVLLLTDGQPTRSSAEDALDAAAEIRSDGIALYCVGLGQDVSPGLLRAMAGAPERYLAAPSAGDLAAVYEHLAVLVTCPSLRDRR